MQNLLHIYSLLCSNKERLLCGTGHPTRKKISHTLCGTNSHSAHILTGPSHPSRTDTDIRLKVHFQLPNPKKVRNHIKEEKCADEKMHPKSIVETAQRVKVRVVHSHSDSVFYSTVSCILTLQLHSQNSNVSEFWTLPVNQTESNNWIILIQIYSTIIFECQLFFRLINVDIRARVKVIMHMLGPRMGVNNPVA